MKSCALLRASVVANDPFGRAIIDRRVRLVGAEGEIPSVMALKGPQTLREGGYENQLKGSWLPGPEMAKSQNILFYLL